ncbi:hypothetical protein RYZ27_11400 [Hyphomonas sp. FCG-A18]|uniref:hypothetical protein n=1 Tax=Hyphomonas sp. FCG-A18 TaxID=3080019 RepID=UPI002B2E3A20|nr:hypothetical protein RYZ27_11400 [Hyphomonas sp. FCG-A18]
MTQSNSLNPSFSFRSLSKCSPAAKALADWMNDRARSAKVTKVRVAEKHMNATRGEVISLFRLLEGMGAGQFKSGRRGYESRFIWRVDPKALAANG